MNAAVPTKQVRTTELSRGTTAADRVADVLLAFSSCDEGLGVSALARQLGLSKAVVHRILQSLVAKGLLHHSLDRGVYELGPAIAILGARSLSRLDIRDVARPELVRLRDATRETTTLSLLDNDRRAYVEQFVSPREIKMTVDIGRSYPLHAGASSLVILANLAEADRNRILDGQLPSLTGETITDREQLLERLQAIRGQGYAASRGERQSGAASVAAPIFSSAGVVVGAISLCGPEFRFDDDAIARFIPMVLDVARKISAGSGGPQRP